MNLSSQHSKLLEAATAIRLDPLDAEAAFMARQLVQATLPHSDPGDVPVWIRKNGNFVLKVQPHYDNEGVSVGIPYGTIPRLLLFWMTTEALRTKSRKLKLGDSLSAFMRQLDLVTTGGRWGTVTRLKKQMERLLRARISFDSTDENHHKWRDMQVAPEGDLWWDYKNPENGSLFESWIELGEKFYEAIVVAPVPLDMRALIALKRSPLALDLYAWATYTTYQTNQTEKARSVSWERLQRQFGGDYSNAKEFGRKARSAFKKIQAVYPDFKMELVKGGIEVMPSQTAITVRPSKRIKSDQ